MKLTNCKIGQKVKLKKGLALEEITFAGGTVHITSFNDKYINFTQDLLDGGVAEILEFEYSDNGDVCLIADEHEVNLWIGRKFVKRIKDKGEIK